MKNIVVELRHLRTRMDRWKWFLVVDDKELVESNIIDDKMGIHIHAQQLLKGVEREDIRIVVLEETRRIAHLESLKAVKERPKKVNPLTVDYWDADVIYMATRQMKIHNTGNMARWVWTIEVDGKEVYRSDKWSGTERGAYHLFINYRKKYNYQILHECSIRRFGVNMGE